MDLPLTEVRGTVQFHIMDHTTFTRNRRGVREHNNARFTAATKYMSRTMCYYEDMKKDKVPDYKRSGK